MDQMVAEDAGQSWNPTHVVMVYWNFFNSFMHIPGEVKDMDSEQTMSNASSVVVAAISCSWTVTDACQS